MSQENKPFGGGWSDKKLDVLVHYLRAYTTALKNQPFELIYIDAFAGAGRALIEDQDGDSLFDEADVRNDESYRHGSPLQAIQTDPPFHRFIFIDRNEESIATLRAQCEQTAAAKAGRIYYITGDANEELLKIAKENWRGRGRRGVAFLDPYALHVTWETIKAIADTKAIDMWLLFPAMAVNRMLPRSGVVPDEWAKKLTETFGDDEWRSVFFQTQQADLLGFESISKTPEPFQRLSDYVTSRLRAVFAGVVDAPLLLRNSGNSPLFLLCFGSGNPKGAVIAKDIANHIIKKQSHGH
jgi:three-Cys-motif partner protein